MCATGDCQRMISGTMFGMTAPGSAMQLVVLVGELVQREHAAGDRVPRVSLPPTMSSRMLPRYSFGGMSFVASPCTSMEMRSSPGSFCARALLPDRVEVLPALPQFLEAGLRRLEDVRVGNRLRRVGPVDELVAVLLGHVEERRQHLARELDGDVPDPVELLVDRQAVEDLAGALADQRLHVREPALRELRRDDLALLVVLRRVFHDEHGQVEVRVAALRRLRGRRAGCRRAASRS